MEVLSYGAQKLVSQRMVFLFALIYQVRVPSKPAFESDNGLSLVALSLIVQENYS